MILSQGNTIIRKLYDQCIRKVPCVEFSNKIDPGARRRLEIKEDAEQEDLDNLDYEANFESFGYSHKQHMREMGAMKEKLQYDIVKQKYFKTKYPNFLTWHDKEQIRLLNRKDPTEWDVMKLSEGFPALPEIIKKILKSKWKMENAERMKRHDEFVRENWRKLNNNEFKELPADFITHLKKFSNRQFNYYNYENVVDYSKMEYKPKLTCTEFSQIITSYEELKNKNKNNIAIESKSIEEQDEFNVKIRKNRLWKVKNTSPTEEDTFITGPIRNEKSMTLSTLRSKLQNKLEKGQEVSPEDLSIIELEWKEEDIEVVPKSTTAVDQLNYTKYNTGKLMKIDQKKPMDYNHLIYPENIRIPKKILKKGCTYKLNDCFYASDGSFLYRVPGMW